MTYDEALEVLQNIQNIAGWPWGYMAELDELPQAIEVFKQMNEDLKLCKEELECWKLDW